MAMGNIDPNRPVRATTDVSPVHDVNQGGEQRPTGDANLSRRTHRSFGQLVREWVHGNRHQSTGQDPMFSSEPSLPVEQKKIRTQGLGTRIAEKVAGPFAAAETFRLKQHDKKEEIERARLARSAPHSAITAPTRAVQPDSPLADAFETAATVTKKAADAAHYLRNGLSVELTLVDSLKQLSLFEKAFASAVVSLQDASATLAGLKLSVEENVAPETTAKMNRTFEKADRVVSRELRQTKKLIDEIDRSIASLKSELTQPAFDVAQAHPEIFSPIAQPFDYRQAGDLLMKRQRLCAGRALECAISIHGAPDAKQAAQFLSDYGAFVAATEDIRKQLEDLRRKSMDPVLAERVQQSKRDIGGTLQSAKVAAAPYMPSARAARVADTTVNRNVSGGDNG